MIENSVEFPCNWASKSLEVEELLLCLEELEELAALGLLLDLLGDGGVRGERLLHGHHLRQPVHERLQLAHRVRRLPPLVLRRQRLGLPASGGRIDATDSIINTVEFD